MPYIKNNVLFIWAYVRYSYGTLHTTTTYVVLHKTYPTNKQPAAVGLCGFQFFVLAHQSFQNQLTIHDWQVDLTPWNLALIGLTSMPIELVGLTAIRLLKFMANHHLNSKVNIKLNFSKRTDFYYYYWVNGIV